MRKTVAGAALILAAGLLTGCGEASTAKKPADAGARATASASPEAGASAAAGTGTPKASEKPAQGGGSGATRKVTLEVQGTGSTQIFYMADTSKAEQVTLPWSTSARITLEGAEAKIGRLVSVVPGSVKGADGQYHAAACVIKVDGKQVADNQGGASDKGCSYKVK